MMLTKHIKKDFSFLMQNSCLKRHKGVDFMSEQMKDIRAIRLLDSQIHLCDERKRNKEFTSYKGLHRT